MAEQTGTASLDQVELRGFADEIEVGGPNRYIWELQTKFIRRLQIKLSWWGRGHNRRGWNAKLNKGGWTKLILMTNNIRGELTTMLSFWRLGDRLCWARWWTAHKIVTDGVQRFWFNEGMILWFAAAVEFRIHELYRYCDMTTTKN